MTTLYLVLGTLLVIMLWISANVFAVRKAFSDVRQQRKHLLISTSIFLGVVAFALLVSASGVLMRFDILPPPAPIFLVVVVATALGIAFSSVGTRLVEYIPLWALVGAHIFRVFAELAIYSAYESGLAPVQMTIHGNNFDIVTALTAPLLAVYLFKRPDPKIAGVWSVAGLLVLGVVIGTGVLSLPLPIRVFMNEPSTVWIAQFPYTLLPGVLVFSAILGHVLIFRKAVLMSRSIKKESPARIGMSTVSA